MAELVALSMVTTVGMIESEMGYRAAKPCYKPKFHFLRWIEVSLL
jgi:hypothetical protein